MPNDDESDLPLEQDESLNSEPVSPEALGAAAADAALAAAEFDEVRGLVIIEQDSGNLVECGNLRALQKALENIYSAEWIRHRRPSNIPMLGGSPR
jgi:hypothetical protein